MCRFVGVFCVCTHVYLHILDVANQDHLSIDLGHSFLLHLGIHEHNLMIEKGRYLHIPREQRLCDACNENEDEVHFREKIHTI